MVVELGSVSVVLSVLSVQAQERSRERGRIIFLSHFEIDGFRDMVLVSKQARLHKEHDNGEDHYTVPFLCETTRTTRLEQR